MDASNYSEARNTMTKRVYIVHSHVKYGYRRAAHASLPSLCLPRHCLAGSASPAHLAATRTLWGLNSSSAVHML